MVELPSNNFEKEQREVLRNFKLERRYANLENKVTAHNEEGACARKNDKLEDISKFWLKESIDILRKTEFFTSSEYFSNNKERKEFLEKASKAFKFAAEHHIKFKEGEMLPQFRACGNFFVNHPFRQFFNSIERVDNLSQLYDLSQKDKMIASILHDTVEDAINTEPQEVKKYGEKVTKEQVRDGFGEDIARYVSGVSKKPIENKREVFTSESDKSGGLLESSFRVSQKQFFAEKKAFQEFKDLFEAGAEDLEVLFIKMEDVLDNARTVEYLKKVDSKNRVIFEMLQIYVFLAEIIGVTGYKNYREIKKIVLQKGKGWKSELVKEDQGYEDFLFYKNCYEEYNKDEEILRVDKTGDFKTKEERADYLKTILGKLSEKNNFKEMKDFLINEVDVKEYPEIEPIKQLGNQPVQDVWIEVEAGQAIPKNPKEMPEDLAYIGGDEHYSGQIARFIKKNFGKEYFGGKKISMRNSKQYFLLSPQNEVEERLVEKIIKNMTLQ